MTSDRRREAMPTDGFRRWLSTVKWPAGEFPHQVAAWLDSVEADLARTHIRRECPPCKCHCHGDGSDVYPHDPVGCGRCCDGGKKRCGECFDCRVTELDDEIRRACSPETDGENMSVGVLARYVGILRIERRDLTAQLAAKDAEYAAVVEAVRDDALTVINYAEALGSDGLGTYGTTAVERLKVNLAALPADGEGTEAHDNLAVYGDEEPADGEKTCGNCYGEVYGEEGDTCDECDGYGTIEPLKYDECTDCGHRCSTTLAKAVGALEDAEKILTFDSQHFGLLRRLRDTLRELRQEGGGDD